ncbi:MAG TPA: 4-hydroxy-3-methylbut-2-enyl diphosphate reductase [Acidobacteriota bacterium]
MEIIIAKNAGLCYGVKRALRLAREVREAQSGPVTTLGELIHNPRITQDLQQQGIVSSNDPEQISSGTVIIRSHGVSPEVYELLENKRLAVTDATCPIVRQIQKRAERLARRGGELVIVGNREHPEIKGLLGYSRGRAVVVETEAQAEGLPFLRKRSVVAQSTLDLVLFEKVVSRLLERTSELRVFNTICRTTRIRQRATLELARQVEALFIIGGKSSSNTRTLYQLSQRLLPRTYFIESAAEIRPEMLAGAERIGISGGASTPPEAIDEAVQTIKNSFKSKSQREMSVQCQR